MATSSSLPGRSGADENMGVAVGGQSWLYAREREARSYNMYTPVGRGERCGGSRACPGMARKKPKVTRRDNAGIASKVPGVTRHWAVMPKAGGEKKRQMQGARCRREGDSELGGKETRSTVCAKCGSRPSFFFLFLSTNQGSCLLYESGCHCLSLFLSRSGSAVVPFGKVGFWFRIRSASANRARQKKKAARHRHRHRARRRERGGRGDVCYFLSGQETRKQEKKTRWPCPQKKREAKCVAAESVAFFYFFFSFVVPFSSFLRRRLICSAHVPYSATPRPGAPFLYSTPPRSSKPQSAGLAIGT